MIKVISVCLAALLFGGSLQAMEGVDCQNQLGEELIKAADVGALEKVHQLLKDGVPVDYESQNCWTALHSAAQSGHLDVCKLLIQNAANVNNMKCEFTSFFLAASNGYLDVCKLFIAHGANINHKIQRNTVLEHAAQSGHSEIVKLLIETGEDKNPEDALGQITGAWDAGNIHLDVCKLLIDKGAAINHHAGELRNTALMKAAYNNHYELCKWLLENGAQPYLFNKFGLTALAQASYKKPHFLEVCKLLIDAMLMPKMQKDVVITLLGIKKYRKPEQLRCLQYDVVKLIGQDMCTAIRRQKAQKALVVDEINKIYKVEMNGCKQELLKYVNGRG